MALDAEREVGETAEPAGRGIFSLLASATVSSVGDGAFVAAAPLLAAFLTRDPLAVAIVSAASAAPWLLVGPWAGALVDRLSRRAVMIAADVARAVALGVLALLVLLDEANVVALSIAAFTVTAGRSFFDSASQAIIPQLVGRSRERLSMINGRLSAADTAGRSLAGPPLGGVLFAAVPWAPFAVDALSFAASGSLLAGVPVKAAPSARPTTGIFQAVREGFRFLFGNRLLVGLAATVSLYNLAYNMGFGVFVLYAQDVLGLGARGFGLVLGAASIGAIVMGWLARPVVARLGIAGGLVTAALTQAACWAAIAWTGSTAVAVAGLIGAGAASTLITVAVVTARQQQVPDQLLGRVVSAFRLFGNGAAPLGSALGGLLASAAGLVAPLWAAAALGVVAFAASIVVRVMK